MTTEEAIKSLENIVEYWSCRPTEQEAAKMAVSALLAQQEADKTKHETKQNLTVGWISVKDALPKPSEQWESYNVVVLRSHFPTSSYDICDSPYDEEFVTTAAYDSNQKIWHLDWDEQLNALIGIEDAPLNGDYVTHWMPLPEPPAT